jgi:rhamnopyranosyl-N-acetylglucosaminyl-diphospho-decaprenol beta-1,3/1,4-galactofuranosyltransferase
MPGVGCRKQRRMAKAEQNVLAVVLTHNAPQSLDRCIRAISGQTCPPKSILVVDSASEKPVRAEDLPSETLPVNVLRSDTNVGPAGGYALGLAEFQRTEFNRAWVMDDDIIPDPECLSALLTDGQMMGPSTFAFPLSVQRDGTVGRWGSWCGFLIAREIVEKVGLPMAELFWWAEDAEYCQWRIPRAGFARHLVEDAVVHHDAIRQQKAVPVWKYYYEARNMLYYHLHVMHRVGWFPRNSALLLVRALIRQKGSRLRCLAAIARGWFDGAFSRLGIRFPLEPFHEHDLPVGDRGFAA